MTAGGPSYSLRRRLLAWLLLATAVMGLLALADTWREARRTAQGVSDRVLTGSALAIAERVTVDQSGGLDIDIPYSSLEMLVSTAQDQAFYRVDGPGGTFLTGYETLAVVPVGADGVGLADGVYGTVPIRLATVAREISTGAESLPFRVTVAESTRARDALARTILLRSALRLLGMILGAAAIVWIAVSAALRPLDRLGQSIARRAPDDLRPFAEPTPAEVQGLLVAINSFMQRLDLSLAALRNFTGNASHQLRTPLAVVRTQLALAARSTDPAIARQAADKADAALVRAERVLAQLLVLARVDAAAGAALPPLTDLAALARDVTAEMIPEARRTGADLGYEGAARLPVRGDPVLLAELLRNLVDNAIAYAGPGARITVAVAPAAAPPAGSDTAAPGASASLSPSLSASATAGPAVMLSVEDDGPGLPDARRAALEQGRRGSALPQPAADRGTGGYGLGLSIVREIASLHGGHLTLAPGAGGRGLRATLVLAAQR